MADIPNRKPRSPYARHQKAPYVYSELLRRWEAEVLRTGSNLTADALELDAAFRRREGLPARKAVDPTLYEGFAEE